VCKQKLWHYFAKNLAFFAVKKLTAKKTQSFRKGPQRYQRRIFLYRKSSLPFHKTDLYEYDGR